MRCQSALICLFGVIAFAPGVTAVTDAPENAYDSIPLNNAFRLRPPTPPPTGPAVPVEPPAKVTLTGITSILGDPLALLEVQSPNKPKSYTTLSVGQREGDIEVVSINDKVGTVTIKNQEVTQVLDFKEADKRSSSIAPPVAVTLPGNPGIPNPIAARIAENNNPVAAIGGFRRSIPTRREVRTATSGDGFSGGVVTSGDGSGVGIKTRNEAVPQQDNQPLSEEKRSILRQIAEERANDAAARGIKLPPLPPM